MTSNREHKLIEVGSKVIWTDKRMEVEYEGILSSATRYGSKIIYEVKIKRYGGIYAVQGNNRTVRKVES